MADYFTQFSCRLDVGTAEEAGRAIMMLNTYQSDLDEEDDGCLGFECSIEELAPTQLWFRDDGGSGDIEHVIGFVLRCAEAFDLQGLWGFGWALTCSKPRLDGFGGGAHIVDLGARRTLEWLDCDHWLAATMDAHVKPVSAALRSAGDYTPTLPSADQV